jgi:hypothetical protein
MESCCHHGVLRWCKRQTVDDDAGKTFPRDIDALPKATRCKQNRVRLRLKIAQELRAGLASLPIDREFPGAAGSLRDQCIDRSEILVACEKDKGPSLRGGEDLRNFTDEKRDELRTIRVRGFCRQIDSGLRCKIERGIQEQVFRCFNTATRLKIFNRMVHGEGSRGKYNRRDLVQEVFPEGFRQVERRGPQKDPFAPDLDPCDPILSIHGEQA